MKGQKNEKIGYAMIAPFLVVFLFFNLYPIIKTFMLSMQKYDGISGEYVGLANYKNIFSDDIFWLALGNTIKIWSVNIVLQISLAFILVMIFTDLKYKIRGLKYYRLLYYLPNLVAATSVALVFTKILDKEYGFVNKIFLNLHFINKAIPWLENVVWAQFSVASIQTWMWFGNSFILFMAAAQAVSKELFEAARVDGAGRFKILKYVTIPSIKPIVIYIGVTSLIGGLQLFEIPMLITDGLGEPSQGLLTVVLYQFNLAFKYQNYGYAAAVAYALFIIIVFTSMIFMLLMNRSQIKGIIAKRKVIKNQSKNNKIRGGKVDVNCS